MSQRVLVPFDGSPLSQRALDHAVSSHHDDQIIVLYVIDPVLAVYEAEAKGLPSASTWYDRMTEMADEICADAKERAAQEECSVTTVTKVGRPGRTIVAYAAEQNVDQIIMGSHGREGVSRLLLGSVAERVIREASIPVTIVR